MTASDAEIRLDSEDRNRREFLSHHFRLDPDDPTHYDLTLNLGTLPLEIAAATAVETLRTRFPERRVAHTISH